MSDLADKLRAAWGDDDDWGGIWPALVAVVEAAEEVVMQHHYAHLHDALADLRRALEETK